MLNLFVRIRDAQPKNLGLSISLTDMNDGTFMACVSNRAGLSIMGAGTTPGAAISALTIKIIRQLLDLKS